MGTRENPGEFDCYAALKPDEPYFVLMGRDIDAAAVVHLWAVLRRRQVMLGLRDDTKEEHAQIAEALNCAREMETYAFQTKWESTRARMKFDDLGYPIEIDGYPIERLTKSGSTR